MKLVMIFLNKIEYLDDLMAAFLEIGVTGATILSSIGMGRIISDHIPIFAGLQDAFAGSSPANNTIVTVVNEDLVGKIADVIQDVCGDFNKPGSGIIISLPIESIYGLGNRD